MPLNVVKNVLSQSLLDSLYNFTRDGKQPTKTNFFGWGANVIGTSNAIFSFLLPDEIKENLAKELIEKGILKKLPTKWAGNIHLMSRNSSIPWHDDGNHKLSITIYLNKIWDSNWGGYFLAKKEDVIEGYIPEYNMCIFFDTPLRHTVSVTSIDSPLRECVQIFVDEE
jgi:2OG-Fe(II) oxygenase superfamily